MTEDSVIDFVTEQEISTVEAFIQALPPLHKRHFVAVHGSASPATGLYFHESSKNHLLGVPMPALS